MQVRSQRDLVEEDFEPRSSVVTPMDNFRPPIIRRRLGALSENGSASNGGLFNVSQKERLDLLQMNY